MNEYKIKLVSPAEHSPAPPTITNDKFAVSKNVISNQHSNTFSALGNWFKIGVTWTPRATYKFQVKVKSDKLQIGIIP